MAKKGSKRDLVPTTEAAPKPDQRLAMKARFVRRLAEWMAGDQARLSIDLQLGKPDAKAWAEIRSLTPIQGWVSVEEAERALVAFLG